MVVFPGVTVHTKEDFWKRIQEVESFSEGIHIDFADNTYVANTLVSLNEIESLPPVFCEVHLMVASPQSYFDRCRELGFSRVIVHIDTLEDQSAEGILNLQKSVHSMGMQFGVAFDDQIELPKDMRFLDEIDLVLIMTIKAGDSGQPFRVEEIEKIRALREQCKDVIIEVDGHMDNETSRLAKEAGADAVVSTSYLSGEGVVEKYNLLRSI